MTFGGFGRYAAPGKNPRYKIASPVQLRNGERLRLARRIKPIAPRPTQRRALDAEEQAGFFKSGRIEHAAILYEG